MKIEILFFRNGINLKSITNKISVVTDGMVAPRYETTLQTLFSNYKLEKTFRSNNLGLFFQCFSTKTYHIYKKIF